MTDNISEVVERLEEIQRLARRPNNKKTLVAIESLTSIDALCDELLSHIRKEPETTNWPEVVERLDDAICNVCGFLGTLPKPYADEANKLAVELRILQPNFSHIRKEPGPRGRPTREEVARAIWPLGTATLDDYIAKDPDRREETVRRWFGGDKIAKADAILSLFPSPCEADDSVKAADELETMRNKWLMATPDKDYTPWAIITRAIETLRRSSPISSPGEVSDAQIKHMVDRFLGWKLPENFRPDEDISFKPTFNDHLPTPMKHNPSGTSLFDATQAEAMVRHMLDVPPASSPGDGERE